MNIQTWLKDASSTLAEAGIESARLDALLILENELKKPRDWVLAHDDEELNSQILKSLNKKLAQRGARTPLAYITNTKEFYGRNFYVDESVLIPRPESEAMIELLKTVIPAKAGIQKTGLDSRLHGNDEPGINTVIDIGTGSGILAITAKLAHPDMHVTASDVSAEAIAVAKKNARDLNAAITFHKSDLFNSLPGMPSTRPYVVLANLPYVPNDLVTSPEITKEPSLALFSGSSGLDHYRMMWQQISELKNKPSYVITESLEDQHLAMVEIASISGYSLKHTDTLVQQFTKD